MHTITADKAKRVRIPDARPGQVFDFKNNGDGTRTLTEVKRVDPQPAKVRIEKRGRYSVGITDRPVNEEALKEALAEFP